MQLSIQISHELWMRSSQINTSVLGENFSIMSRSPLYLILYVSLLIIRMACSHEFCTPVCDSTVIILINTSNYRRIVFISQHTLNTKNNVRYTDIETSYDEWPIDRDLSISACIWGSASHVNCKSAYIQHNATSNSS